MKLSSVVSAAAAVAMLALSSGLASAQTAGVPIHVTNFQYSPPVLGSDETGGPVTSGVVVTFTNTSKQMERGVVFGVYDAAGRQVATVTRHGHFAPGVSITRNFGDVRLKDKDAAPVKAAPIEVTFADGTKWDAQ